MPATNLWLTSEGDEYTKYSGTTAQDADEEILEWCGITASAVFQTALGSIPDLSLDAKILEIGCGTGSKLAVLEKLGYSNLFGTDVNEASVKTCQQLHSRLNVKLVKPGQRYDGTLFGLEGKTEKRPFKVVMTCATLIHVPYEEREQFYDMLRDLADYYVCWEATNESGRLKFYPHGDWTFYGDNFDELCCKNFGDRLSVQRLQYNPEWPTKEGMSFDTVAVHKL